MLRLSTHEFSLLKNNQGKKKEDKKKITSASIAHANRGKAFEEMILLTNEQYKRQGLAIVQQIEVPWRVVREGDRIVSAYPKEDSSVDFFGLASGKAFAFDAKSMREEDRFPLRNIKEHQMEFLEYWKNQGGYSFFLIEWVLKNEVYLFPYTKMKEFWLQKHIRGKGSIPYQEFQRFQRVQSGRGYILDYLNFVLKVL